MENIILSVEILEPKQLDSSFVFDVYEYSDEHKKKFVLEEWITAATEKGLTAIEISPSYGCALLAIFKNYEFAEGHTFPISAVT